MVMLNAFKASLAGMSPTQRFVAWVLADCHNAETGRCDPSIAYICDLTGFSNRTVITAIDELEKAGMVTANGGNGQRKSYTLRPKSGEAASLVGSDSATESSEPPSLVTPPNQCSSFTGEPPSPVNLLHKAVNLLQPTSEPVAQTSEPPSHETEGNGNRNRRKQLAPAPAAQKSDSDFQAACAVALDLTASAPLREAWDEWQRYRQSRHSAKGKAHVTWTNQAATIAAKSIIRAADQFGEAQVISAIHKAIQSDWKGLHFDNLKPIQKPAAKTTRALFGNTGTNKDFWR